MKTPSSKAQDRSMKEWLDAIESGQIKLPRFQRPEAWDRTRICSLLNTIIHNLPLGITLVLNVDPQEEPFVSRFLETAPERNGKVNEHLLDGQQRLTAFWRAMYNNYELTKYFIYFTKFDESREEVDEDDYFEVRHVSRWYKNNGTQMPLWADDPMESFKRGMIPIDLLRPGENASEYEKWVTKALSAKEPSQDEEDAFSKLKKWQEEKADIIDIIRDLREVIAHYNLPYLYLPQSTSKDTALQVFINMNTNSKPLSQYDIIRAEIESIKGKSLDDLQKHLDERYPKVKYYEELPYLILATSALLQDKLPNQRGMWDMRKDKMVDNWSLMESGLNEMAHFLEREGIYDRKRLPTNAVLAVIATLHHYMPEKPDAKGKAITLLKKYLWSAFFTDRYENSAATHAYNDFIALKRILRRELKDDGQPYSEKDVPVLDRSRHPLSPPEELIKVGWPIRENIRGRGIMAIFSKLGALDFADGRLLDRTQLLDGTRHYHHIFPEALLRDIDSEASLTLNCALITDKTNMDISNKDPLNYLRERFQWHDEDLVLSRLNSHLIPVKELSNGGYAGLSAQEKVEKLKVDYDRFIQKRARYVAMAIEKLCNGRDVVAEQIIREVEGKSQDEDSVEQ